MDTSCGSLSSMLSYAIYEETTGIWSQEGPLGQLLSRCRGNLSMGELPSGSLLYTGYLA